MEKEIQIKLMREAEEFMREAKDQVSKKFLFAFRKTTAGLKGDWFKKMEGSNLFEFRVDADNKFYRMLAFWDSRGKARTLIVCTHCFAKKKNETPRKEIEKAEAIMKIYFETT